MFRMLFKRIARVLTVHKQRAFYVVRSPVNFFSYFSLTQQSVGFTIPIQLLPCGSVLGS